MKAKIVVVGELDVILPFKAIGVDIYPVTTPEEVRTTLAKLLSKHETERVSKEDVGLILISDEIAPYIHDFLQEIRGTPLPCILTIPGSKGSYGFGINEMRELIKKAVGVDIMK